MGYKSEEDKLCRSEDLAEAASQARTGMTQQEAADHLGVTKQSVSKAENKEVGSKMNRLRIRMIEEIGGHNVEGPYWTIHPADEEEQQ